MQVPLGKRKLVQIQVLADGATPIKRVAARIESLEEPGMMIMATMEMSNSVATAANRPIPSACAVHFLRDHRDETYVRIRGIAAFPMRPLSRDTEALWRYEASVERRFAQGGCNLFGLSLDPLRYRGQPGRERDEQLYEFFIENIALCESVVRTAMGEAWTDSALRSGLIVEEGPQVLRSPFRLIPFDGQLFLADAYSKSQDSVYLSNDSLFMAHYVSEILDSGIWVNSVVDMGTGSGILACHAARKIGGAALGLDINQRALHFADANAYINRIHANWLNCDYEHAPIPCGALVIANPPFVFTPPAAGLPVHSDGGNFGLELTLKVLERLNRELPIDSHLALITQSPVFETAERPHLVEVCSQRFDSLDLEFENVGDMPPFSRYADFYEGAGVKGIQQLICRGRRGRGTVHYQGHNRFAAEVCFG